MLVPSSTNRYRTCGGFVGAAPHTLPKGPAPWNPTGSAAPARPPAKHARHSTIPVAAIPHGAVNRVEEPTTPPIYHHRHGPRHPPPPFLTPAHNSCSVGKRGPCVGANYPHKKTILPNQSLPNKWGFVGAAPHTLPKGPAPWSPAGSAAPARPPAKHARHSTIPVAAIPHGAVNRVEEPTTPPIYHHRHTPRHLPQHSLHHPPPPQKTFVRLSIRKKLVEELSHISATAIRSYCLTMHINTSSNGPAASTAPTPNTTHTALRVSRALRRGRGARGWRLTQHAHTFRWSFNKSCVDTKHQKEITPSGPPPVAAHNRHTPLPSTSSGDTTTSSKSSLQEFCCSLLNRSVALPFPKHPFPCYNTTRRRKGLGKLGSGE